MTGGEKRTWYELALFMSENGCLVSAPAKDQTVGDVLLVLLTTIAATNKPMVIIHWYGKKRMQKRGSALTFVWMSCTVYLSATIAPRIALGATSA